ncbi:MAG: transposase [Clostridia bacterium]|nr:transposase [Clostridia bacterium]
MNKQIGKVNKKVIELLGLEYKEELPIILGDSNIEHMKRQHPEDYDKYGNRIMEIVNNPTYVARNPNQGSIEYIKKYKIDNEFILVAVRISNKGTMFAKTMFKMTERKINIYLENGYAKKYK